jgi:hypothetical protein
MEALLLLLIILYALNEFRVYIKNERLNYLNLLDKYSKLLKEHANLLSESQK